MFCATMKASLRTRAGLTTLHKKHVSIAYHAVGWAVAAEVIRVGWISTKQNLADAMTKVLTALNREELFCAWTY